MSETSTWKLWILFITLFCISVISGIMTVMFWGKSSLLGISITNGKLMAVCFLLKPISLITSSIVIYKIKNENLIILIVKALVIGLAIIDAILLLGLLLIFILFSTTSEGSWGVGAT